ncbi:CBS domain-containing protein [Sphingomonas pituitosa]|uniref:RraA family protein n=1 Tax=Sphingomonas pituitosa TaxID=99597 RepID=UPI000B225609|nr:CBS domain-containing protein [Sphingomonas pituitosa]
MAPTSSTTLQLAIGDALAVAVSRTHGFTRADFLRHHPASLLGRQSLAIRTLMRTGEELPMVGPDAPVADLLAVMSAGRMGAACVVGDCGRLLGLVVDGDLRRHFQSRRDVYDTPAAALMQAHPQVIDVTATLGDALLLQALDCPAITEVCLDTESKAMADMASDLPVTGAVGAVIDGATRDTADVRALGLPVYARSQTCDDIKYEGTLKAMNRPITMGEVQIANGDVVFADADGIVAVPRAMWAEIEEAAWNVLSNEARIRMAAARGRDVDAILAECGAF